LVASEASLPRRFATANDLLRIEDARQSLARTARWAQVLAVYIPTVLGLVTFAFAFTTYSGSWLERALIGLLEGLVFVGVFTLPVLLTGTGSALFAHRRLARDAENGFAIAQAGGEVTWDKRQRAYVARVNGKRVLSPFYTQYASVPAFWEHFDKLAPGPHVFELLPESRLVLHAEPVTAPAPSSASPSHALYALALAFGNRMEDLTANRQGQASGAQRRRLLFSQSWLFLMLPLLVFASYLASESALRTRDVRALLAVVLALGLTVFVLVLAARALTDVLEGRLESAAGTVSLHYGKTDTTGRIGTAEFTMSTARSRALQSGRCYRVYFFRHSRIVAAIEPAG
jgi:hypothetical protein